MKRTRRRINTCNEMMKAYEPYEGEYVAALSAKEALDWYMKETGADPKDCYPEDEIEEVANSKKLFDDDGSGNYSTVGEILKSLDKAGDTSPQQIGSSNI